MSTEDLETTLSKIINIINPLMYALPLARIILSVIEKNYSGMIKPILLIILFIGIDKCLNEFINKNKDEYE